MYIAKYSFAKKTFEKLNLDVGACEIYLNADDELPVHESLNGNNAEGDVEVTDGDSDLKQESTSPSLGTTDKNRLDRLDENLDHDVD